MSLVGLQGVKLELRPPYPSMLARRLRELPTHSLASGGVVIEASAPWARLIGLAGLALADVPPAHALLLRPCSSVHTFGMRFDLDLLFLTAAGDVLAAELNVPPGRIRTRRGAAAVLEYPHRDEGELFRFDGCRYGRLLSRPIPRGARA